MAARVFRIPSIARPRTALFCSSSVEAQVQPLLDSVASAATGEQYDLRPAGASGTQPFETSDGSPTDITSSLAGGASKVGYNRRYADGWSRIFGGSKSEDDKAKPPPGLS